MLNDAINTLKGNKPMDDFETKVDLTVDAFVPPSYIKNEALKMDIYKRIAGIETMEEYEDMRMNFLSVLVTYRIRLKPSPDCFA